MSAYFFKFFGNGLRFILTLGRGGTTLVLAFNKIICIFGFLRMLVRFKVLVVDVLMLLHIVLLIILLLFLDRLLLLGLSVG